MHVHLLIRARREKLGMTQSDLAHHSGLSLPTIQNLERAIANPTLSTLERLLAVLGMQLGIEDAEPDWDRLCTLGLPLTAERPARVTPRLEDLVLQVRLATLQLERDDGTQDVERRREGLQALLLALKNHFPDLYGRHFAGSELVSSITEADVDGRIIKLQRIARDALSRYL